MMWRKYRTSILLAVTFILLFSMFWFFPSLAFILFLSMLLSLLLGPAVDAFAYKRIPRFLGSAIVLITFFTFILGFLTTISRDFIPTFSRFVADLPNLSISMQHLPILQQSDFFVKEFDELLKELTNTSIGALKSSLSLIISIFNKFLDLVIIIFVTFYLLKDGDRIKEYLAHLFPRKDYTRVLNLFDQILNAMRIYICSQLVICLITGLIVFFYYTARGLPYASVFAVVSGISEFVPVLGPTLASAFGIVLTATQNPWVAIQTLVFYLLLTQINHNLIYPALIGKSLNLHPIATILGIIFGGEILGAAGMFLAVPSMVICKILIADIYQDRLHLSMNKKTKKNKKKLSEEAVLYEKTQDQDHPGEPAGEMRLPPRA